MPRNLVWSLIALAFVTIPGSVRGADPQPNEERAKCAEQHVSGQTLRQEGKLVEARSAFLTCSHGCPPLIQSECITWYEELRKLVPSVIIRAKQGNKDLFDVNLIVDGKLESSKLDGLEVSLNPGPHRFRLEHGTAHLEEQMLILSGEQRRSLVFNFASPASATAALPPAAPVEPERPMPPAVLVAGGIGLAAAGTAVVMGLAGKSKENEALDTPSGGCAPNCNDDQLAGMRSNYRIANVAWAIAGVSAVTSLVLYLTRPAVQTPSKPSAALTGSAGVAYGVGMGPGGAALTLGGKF